MRLQAGDEVHVVLGQHLQQRVEGLAELRIVLQGRDDAVREERANIKVYFSTKI